MGNNPGDWEIREDTRDGRGGWWICFDENPQGPAVRVYDLAIAEELVKKHNEMAAELQRVYEANAGNARLLRECQVKKAEFESALAEACAYAFTEEFNKAMEVIRSAELCAYCFNQMEDDHHAQKELRDALAAYHEARKPKDDG